MDLFVIAVVLQRERKERSTPSICQRWSSFEHLITDDTKMNDECLCVHRKSTLEGWTQTRASHVSYAMLLWSISRLLWRQNEKECGCVWGQSFPLILLLSPPERLRFEEGKRTDDARREMEEEKRAKRSDKVLEREGAGEGRKEHAILIRKKSEYSIVKPRERVAQSEALHVASTRGERERFSLSSTRVFHSRASFPHFSTVATIERSTLSFATLQSGEFDKRSFTCLHSRYTRQVATSDTRYYIFRLWEKYLHICRINGISLCRPCTMESYGKVIGINSGWKRNYMIDFPNAFRNFRAEF